MMAALRRHHRDELGASLAELLVVMVISTLIATLSVTAIVTATRGQRIFQATQDNLDESRVALDRIRKEVRGARRIFEDPTGQHLQFWFDDNQDDRIQSVEIVHYEYETVEGEGQIHHWLTPAPDERQVVARDLLPDTSNAIFGYDQPAPSTRIVTIALEVDAGDAEGIEPVTVEAEVRLRNVA